MGNIFQKIWSVLQNTEYQFKIIILGLANAGKTSLLYKLLSKKKIRQGGKKSSYDWIKLRGNIKKKHSSSNMGFRRTRKPSKNMGVLLQRSIRNRFCDRFI